MDGTHALHASTTTLVVPTGVIACEGCAAIVEARLRQNPHVVRVHIDARQQVAHVEVHDGMATAEELAELVAEAYGERSVVPLPKPEGSSHAHVHVAQPAGGGGAKEARAPRPAAQA